MTTDCGNDPLNNYIKVVASQDQRRLCSATRIAVTDEQPKRVIGYSTLANTLIPRSLISEPRRLPRYDDIPAVLLARLAVDLWYQKQGLGELLVGDAILSSLTISEYSGCRFLLIDVYPSAVRWYARFGFREIPGAPSGSNVKMFLDLTAIEGLARASLEQARQAPPPTKPEC